MTQGGPQNRSPLAHDPRRSRHFPVLSGGNQLGFGRYVPVRDEAYCSRCERTLPVGEFARDASKRSGRKSICRECDREKSKAYYRANRERVIARVRAQQAAKRAG
jgi:hypothetical protein